jgi:hypothetical protein
VTYDYSAEVTGHGQKNGVMPDAARTRHNRLIAYGVV